VELDIRHLRLVVAVADTGSLSRAARQLGVQQPSVTTQLRRIEEALGGPLFERSTAGVRVTPRGAAVLRRARPILAKITAIGAPPAPEPGTPATVRVRTLVLPFEVLLPFLEQLAPGIRWELRAGGLVDGLAAVQSGDADLYFGLRWPDDPTPLPGVEIDDYVNELAWVLLPESHPLATAPLVQLRSLAGETWVSRSEPDLHAALLRDCRRAGFEPRVQFHVGDGMAVQALVAQGSAVSLTSPLSPLAPGVVMRPCPDALGHTFALAHRPDGRMPPDLVRVLSRLARWTYAFRARQNDELRAQLPEDLLAVDFPQPYRGPAPVA
jgi:DNA-binding transcriptional LysR family regulator